VSQTYKVHIIYTFNQLADITNHLIYRAFYNLTLSLTDERRFDEALETIEAAKLINPSQLDSYHSLKGWYDIL
jgi:hypothetical protein